MFVIVKNLLQMYPAWHSYFPEIKVRNGNNPCISDYNYQLYGFLNKVIPLFEKSLPNKILAPSWLTKLLRSTNFNIELRIDFYKRSFLPLSKQYSKYGANILTIFALRPVILCNPAPGKSPIRIKNLRKSVHGKIRSAWSNKTRRKWKRPPSKRSLSLKTRARLTQS